MASLRPNARRCGECGRLHEGKGPTCERCIRAERKAAEHAHDDAVRRIRG